MVAWAEYEYMVTAMFNLFNARDLPLNSYWQSLARNAKLIESDWWRAADYGFAGKLYFHDTDNTCSSDHLPIIAIRIIANRGFTVIVSADKRLLASINVGIAFAKKIIAD